MTTTFRPRDAQTFDMAKRFAAHYGRSVNEELNLAVELHVHAHALRLLDEPELAEAKGLDAVAAERQRILADIADLERRAFRRPTALDFADEI